jgi:putative phosphoribosyl transferase
MLYVDRADAGRHLAHRLRRLRGVDIVVLGLARGGVPVAFEVAAELHAPLDVIVIRKLGVSFQPEYGFGAIGEGGVRVIDDYVVRRTGLAKSQMAEVEARERLVLDRRLNQLRRNHPPAPLADRTVIIVDDGIATGSTARAACLVARAQGAGRVILAVPVGSVPGMAALRRDADEVVCLRTPARLAAVGEWYSDFSQVSDEEVAILLDKAAASLTGPGSADPDPAEVVLNIAGLRLPGSLVVPDRATGVVVFAHGSGSSRHSPGNRYVAGELQASGLATVLADLRTPREEQLDARTGPLRFDIDLLATRVTALTDWVLDYRPTAGLPVGLFGASTGAAAALVAAAARPGSVAAVVSRGGRPDLAGPHPRAVSQTTLLIVGALDAMVIELNRKALRKLTARHAWRSSRAPRTFSPNQAPLNK